MKSYTLDFFSICVIKALKVHISMEYRATVPPGTVKTSNCINSRVLMKTLTLNRKIHSILNVDN